MAAWPFFSQLLGRSVFFLFFFRTFFPLQWTRSSVAFSICVSFSVPTADCCCCPYVDVYHMIITSVFLFTSNPILAGVVAWLFSRISVEIVGQQTITTAKKNKQTNKQTKPTRKTSTNFVVVVSFIRNECVRVTRFTGLFLPSFRAQNRRRFRSGDSFSDGHSTATCWSVGRWRRANDAQTSALTDFGCDAEPPPPPPPPPSLRRGQLLSCRFVPWKPSAEKCEKKKIDPSRSVCISAV